jgi:hypothetical protein
VHIADDRHGGERHADFTRKYGVNPDGAVLVRPDGVIAWRAKGVAADPQRELRRVLARLGLAESRPCIQVEGDGHRRGRRVCEFWHVRFPRHKLTAATTLIAPNPLSLPRR